MARGEGTVALGKVVARVYGVLGSGNGVIMARGEGSGDTCPKCHTLLLDLTFSNPKLPKDWQDCFILS